MPLSHLRGEAYGLVDDTSRIPLKMAYWQHIDTNEDLIGEHIQLLHVQHYRHNKLQEFAHSQWHYSNLQDVRFL